MGRDAQLGRDKDEPESRQETAREMAEGKEAGEPPGQDRPGESSEAPEKSPGRQKGE